MARSACFHMAELYLRHVYARKVQENQRLAQLDDDKQRLEERNEQLQAEKERLLYGVQRRGRPLDDDDDCSAIRRGLHAGGAPPAQSHRQRRGSERGKWLRAQRLFLDWLDLSFRVQRRP